MILVNNKIDLAKLEQAYDYLYHCKQYSEGSRLAMNGETIRAVRGMCFDAGLSQPTAKYREWNGGYSYNGVKILCDDSLTYGEVLVLIQIA